MDFRLSPEQEELRRQFFQVCQELEKYKPPNFGGLEGIYTDEGWAFHRYCSKEFARRRWLSLGWPGEYGGQGNMMDRVFFAEARGYYDIPGIDGFGVGMLAPTLLQLGSEEIKRKFLPPIAKAEVIWCQLWSEPNAGSDLAGVSTTAIKKDNEYVINGQKIWTTGAHRADWGFGVFKSDPSGRKRHNLSFLLLDMKTPGITVKPLKFMHGGHAYNEVYFDDVRVPAGNIIGQASEGWVVVNTLASFERSNIESVMSMVRQLEDLVGYCNKTKKGGKPLSKDLVIRSRLAQMACEVEAARALAYRVADLQNRNEMSLMDASAVKVFASELWERFVGLVTDILGPYAQVKASPWAPMEGFWEKAYQEHFVYTVAAGTNEIQRNIIAWHGLGLPRMG